MWRENNVRALLALLGVVSAITGPWWLTIVPMALLSLRFRAWEVLCLGLLMDFMWLPVPAIPYFFILSIAILWGCEPLRKELLLA